MPLVLSDDYNQHCKLKQRSVNCQDAESDGPFRDLSEPAGRRDRLTH